MISKLLIRILVNFNSIPNKSNKINTDDETNKENRPTCNLVLFCVVIYFLNLYPTPLVVLIYFSPIFFLSFLM